MAANVSLSVADIGTSRKCQHTYSSTLLSGGIVLLMPLSECQCHDASTLSGSDDSDNRTPWTMTVTLTLILTMALALTMPLVLK